MEQEYLELAAPLQNSIEIGQTSKGFLYVKGIKLYFGQVCDDEVVFNRLFGMYDKVKEAIDSRND